MGGAPLPFVVVAVFEVRVAARLHDADRAEEREQEKYYEEARERAPERGNDEDVLEALVLHLVPALQLVYETWGSESYRHR